MNVRLIQIMPATNSTYPKGGVSCFADTFVVAESSVLLMKFSGKNPALSLRSAVSGKLKKQHKA